MDDFARAFEELLDALGDMTPPPEPAPRAPVLRVLTTRMSAQEAVAALMKNQGLKEF